MARKARGADEWFVGAVTDENAREAVIPLSFLPSGSGQKYEATVYADGEDADWESNPQSYRIYTRKVKPSATLRIPLAPGGGAMNVREHTTGFAHGFALTSATASNRGNRCRCGAQLKHQDRPEGLYAGSNIASTSTTASNHGNHCRCGAQPKQRDCEKKVILFS